MKTVKSGQDGVIRVSDDRAKQLVKAGTHMYCAKEEWKDNVRDLKKKKVNAVEKVEVKELNKVDGEPEKKSRKQRVKKGEVFTHIE